MFAPVIRESAVTMTVMLLNYCASFPRQPQAPDRSISNATGPYQGGRNCVEEVVCIAI